MSSTHECLNCHNKYEGNYCPHCGQSAATQRFTAKSALSQTLDVWGMGNRSLPRTVWHLVTRPGQMIGDYLDGKRMPYFPPVKMLFVLCIFFALMLRLSDWIHQVPALPDSTTVIDKSLLDEADKEYVFNFGLGNMSFSEVSTTITSSLQWFKQQKAISLIVAHIFFTFFTWLVFRRAPLRPQSTLAENFFVQVLVSGQMVVLSSLYVLLFGHTKEDMFYPLPGIVLLALFVWDFKYLFGYTWLKTIWRTLLVHILSFFCVILSIAFFFMVLALFAEERI